MSNQSQLVPKAEDLERMWCRVRAPGRLELAAYCLWRRLGWLRSEIKIFILMTILALPPAMAAIQTVKGNQRPSVSFEGDLAQRIPVDQVRV